MCALAIVPRCRSRPLASHPLGECTHKHRPHPVLAEPSQGVHQSLRLVLQADRRESDGGDRTRQFAAMQLPKHGFQFLCRHLAQTDIRSRTHLATLAHTGNGVKSMYGHREFLPFPPFRGKLTDVRDTASNPEDFWRVDVPAEIWRNSESPRSGRVIRIYVAVLFTVTALVMLSPGPLYWALIAGGLAIFALTPSFVYTRLDGLAQSLQQLDAQAANDMLRELPRRRLIRYFAPFAWLPLQQAQLHLRRGDGRAASLALAETVRLTRADAPPQLLSAEAMAAMMGGDRKRALQLLRKLEHADQLRPRDHLHFGLMLLLDRGKPTSALEHLQAAREALGGYPRVLAGLALAYQRSGDPAEAAKLLESLDHDTVADDALALDLVKRAEKGLRSFLRARGKRSKRSHRAVEPAESSNESRPDAAKTPDGSQPDEQESVDTPSLRTTSNAANQASKSRPKKSREKKKPKGKRARQQARRDARRKAKAEAKAKRRQQTQREHAEVSKIREQAQQPERAEVSKIREQAQQTERAETSKRPEQAQQAQQTERAEASKLRQQAQQAQQTERAETSKRPEQAQQAQQPERAETSKRPEQAQQGQSAGPAKTSTMRGPAVPRSGRRTSADISSTPTTPPPRSLLFGKTPEQAKKTRLPTRLPQKEAVRIPSRKPAPVVRSPFVAPPKVSTTARTTVARPVAPAPGLFTPKQARPTPVVPPPRIPTTAPVVPSSKAAPIVAPPTIATIPKVPVATSPPPSANLGAVFSDDDWDDVLSAVDELDLGA